MLQVPRSIMERTQATLEAFGGTAVRQPTAKPLASKQKAPPATSAPVTRRLGLDQLFD